MNNNFTIYTQNASYLINSIDKKTLNKPLNKIGVYLVPSKSTMYQLLLKKKKIQICKLYFISYLIKQQ